MAIATNSIILHSASGAIGKDIVVKTYRNKTFISKFPDMSKVTPSKQQKEKRNLLLRR